MPEIQSTQHSPILSWVMMDQRFRFKDPGSFRADDETTAETQDSNGDPVRISFDLLAPPGSSKLCLHCPEEREPSWWDFVVASHHDAVLFRIEVNFPGLWVNHGYAMDYFIYRASSSSAKLTLLPRCFFTEAEADEEAASSWRRESRMVHSSSIGLLADGEQFWVAELCLEGGLNTAPLEAKLFRLCSSSSLLAANGGGGQWELMHATSRDSKVTFQDVLGWKTHGVIPFSSYLCWADYNRGVLFCDVRSTSPELQYLRLPVNDMPHERFPQFFRTVCVTDKGDTMKFAKVVGENSICPNCNSGSGFTISLWTMLVRSCDVREWVQDFLITHTELWAMEGYNHRELSCSVPQFPVVSMDDPHILYFVLRGTPVPTDEATSWIVTLDMKSKKVLSYVCIKGLSDDNFSTGFGFFPSNFTKHLMKHSRLQQTHAAHSPPPPAAHSPRTPVGHSSSSPAVLVQLPRRDAAPVSLFLELRPPLPPTRTVSPSRVGRPSPARPLVQCPRRGAAHSQRSSGLRRCPATPRCALVRPRPRG